MPIHTPSPHRFLAPAPQSTQKKTKPQSGLRHGVNLKSQGEKPNLKPKSINAFRTPDVVSGEGKKITPAKRFVFGGCEQGQGSEERNGEGSVKGTQRAGPPKLGKVESIDESSPSSPLAATAAGNTWDGNRTVALPRVEYTDEHEAEEEEEQDEMLFETLEKHKRRRLSPQPPSSPSMSHRTPQQLTYHAHHQEHFRTPIPPPKSVSDSHRFKLPAPRTPSAFENTTTPSASTSRPHFILPLSSPSPTKAATPLPETFSPSRKSGKYVQNGLASTLQSWIIETADTGYTARHSAGGMVWGRDKDDGVKMRVRVSSVSGGRNPDNGQDSMKKEVEARPGGVVFITGMTDVGLYNSSRASSMAFGCEDGMSGVENETEVRVMLAGQGGARSNGKGGVMISAGTVIGIRAPMWDVDLNDTDVTKGRRKWIPRLMRHVTLLMSDVTNSRAKRRKTTRHFRPIFKMSRPAEPQQPPETGLLALVDELLLAIIDQVDSHTTLCNLAATCSRLRGIAEPYVWRNLLITRGDHAREVAYALDSREARPSYVHELSIRYRYNQSAGIEDLNHLIGLMDKLRHLTIESPCPNNTEFPRNGYFDQPTRIDYRSLLEGAVHPRPGLPPTLPMLQSLSVTLHGHGPDDKKFVFGRSAIMFFHPTLRRITLSCTNFDAEITHAKILPSQRKSTPLQSLTLIECNVNVKFLDVVLSLPKALKELDIGERQHVFRECHPSHDTKTRTSHPLFLDALARQAHSLERLAHSSGNTGYISYRQPDETGDGRLRHLINLQYLELGAESVLLGCLENNDCPTSLQKLKVTDAAWVNRIISTEQKIMHSRILLQRCNEVASRLSHPVDIDIRFNSKDHEVILRTVPVAPWSATFPALSDSISPIRGPVYQLANALISRNKQLRLFTQTFLGDNRYIPPYMYGEEAPREEQFYDSDDFWRLSGRSYKLTDDEVYIAELIKGEKPTCTTCKGEFLTCYNEGVGDACIYCENLDLECIYETATTAQE
ncbi:hypothetical protein P280DRAFT_511886 [Massarina eburnea CBS 473.64]|uniref:F-box domain-containing protein n=1 Tax=Massarina eburnea CBS 473.64 TaxID=1395130 RepID=A0A6A6RKA3_9PLEO|nr:hypothetical protein P280DRAFT_511886 [Massarina eburnea CBS 473.64]